MGELCVGELSEGELSAGNLSVGELFCNLCIYFIISVELKQPVELSRAGFFKLNNVRHIPSYINYFKIYKSNINLYSSPSGSEGVVIMHNNRHRDRRSDTRSRFTCLPNKQGDFLPHRNISE